MMFSKTITLAALASLTAALPTANPVKRSGGVNIVNNLGETVYAWSVSDRVSNMHSLSANGGNYQESWQTNENGGGISIKLSNTQEQSNVLQFEYTQSGDTIYWDMSCIDLGGENVFTKYGFSVTPSTTDGNCPSVNCAAGDTACAEAYLKPDDDHATHGCPIDTSFSVSIGN
ncbi:GPI anchored cell wall protein [Aspergillus bombycis]|uniref:GPI anchored cell wall protein n=1 Tax=Aspergillus bombycis TaxID=109264 RepID=A0A1F8A265_9EURO|nr:GPI anchored cell wall protein [Aspergillus bombycis]OGM45787.1 GPI anchored cell wall protein [Aspergillus bombycis]